MANERSTRTQLGWREWVALPELEIPAVKAKLDTGARTSALHAFYTEPFDNGSRLRFGVHPLQRRLDLVIECEAEIVDHRLVSDSGGRREHRYIIETELRLGERVRRIELSLADRESMAFRMLLGRTALRGWSLVDPKASYRAGRSLARSYPPRRRRGE